MICIESKSAEIHDLNSVRSGRHHELVSLAREELVCGDEEAALEKCMAALRYGRSYESLALAGTLLAILGRQEDSVNFTREAVESAPHRADCYYDLAATLLEMGKPKEALHWAEQGVRLVSRRHDDVVDFMFAVLVETLVELRRFDEAEAALKQGRRQTDDPLELLDSAEALLESRRRRPSLRLVVTDTG